MTKIGLISDTHIPRNADAIPPQVKTALAGVDRILHGGDIYIAKVLDELEVIAPVLAVRGNGEADPSEDPRVKDSHRLAVEGLVVGVTHHLDYPESPWMRSFEKTMDVEFGGPVDVIVFGSSHNPMIETYKGVLLVNPGSPTLPMGCHGLGTVGVLEIDQGKAEARIIDLTTIPIQQL